MHVCIQRFFKKNVRLAVPFGCRFWALLLRHYSPALTAVILILIIIMAA